MKKILTTLAVLFLVISVYGRSTDDFRKFYRQYKHDKGVINFWIPSVLLKVATINQDDYIQNFAHSTSKLRIMIKEENASYLYEKLNKSLSKSNSYKDLLFVKDGNDDVRITARIKDNRIREILIIVNDQSNFVAIQLKGNYHINDLKKLAKEIS